MRKQSDLRSGDTQIRPCRSSTLTDSDRICLHHAPHGRQNLSPIEDATRRAETHTRPVRKFTT